MAAARAHHARLVLVRTALDHTFPPTDPIAQQAAVVQEEEALPAALAMARALKARVVLLHALALDEATFAPTQATGSPREEMTAREEATHQYLVGLLAGIADERVQAQPVVRTGEAAATSAAVAREYGATLIAMATHGRTGLPRLLMGSVAATVLRRTDLPRLLIRPRALATTGVPARATTAG